MTPEMAAPDSLSFARPKGAQLREILTGLASSMGTGALLPSERVLADNYHVARMTVRQVIDSMVAEGLLYRRHGQGTFVAGPKLVQSDTLVSFSQDMRARGLTPGARVLTLQTGPAPADVAAKMGLVEDAPVTYIVRIRTADGVPIALERAYFPAERFPGLDQLDLTDTSLWDILEQRWGIRIGSAQQRVSAVLPSATEARELGIDRRQPCFAIEGVARAASGEVVECGRSLYRGDRYDVMLGPRRVR